MNILELIFRRPQKNSAAVAKERLQIIVSHERSSNQNIEVIAKYFTGIDKNSVRVELQRMGSCSVLELNVALPEQAEESN
jgi:cell division topological specificity factor